MASQDDSLNLEALGVRAFSAEELQRDVLQQALRDQEQQESQRLAKLNEKYAQLQLEIEQVQQEFESACMKDSKGSSPVDADSIKWKLRLKV
jgi:hypothetical protein